MNSEAKSKQKVSKAEKSGHKAAGRHKVAVSSSDGSAVNRLRADWPALQPDARSAYAQLATDAQRAELGARTRSENVLGEATSWAVDMSGALKRSAVLGEHYSAQRFSYFLEAVSRLGAQLQKEAQANQGAASSRATASTVRSQGMDVRDRLAGRLRRFAGKRVELLAQIDAATGRADTVESLAQGLEGVASLCDAWRARSDAASKLLAGDAGLTVARSDEARAAARALRTKGADAVLAGKLQGRDSAAVNILEGGVLIEMQEAMQAFAEARLEDASVPRLVPGPGTRGALVRPAGSGKASKADDTSAGGKSGSGGQALLPAKS
jgi:hypothetical protein